MSHLLDTNSAIDHLRRGPNSNVTARLAAAPPGECRPLFGRRGGIVLRSAAQRARPRGRQPGLLAQFRQQFVSLPFDDPAAEAYGRIREHLASVGKPIGPHDLMIAAIALAQGLTLVTHNTAEFSRVPGLTLEDWQ